MKVQIRKGVFETNSSSEHSVCIMKSDIYNRWKNGEILIRFYKNSKSDFPDTWGNFWSEQFFYEYAEPDKADKLNKKLFEKERQSTLNALNAELADMRDSHDHIYGNYEQDMIDAIDETTRSTIEDLNAITKFYDGLYITYEEYEQRLKDDDVYSIFMHENEGVTMFGTYYHS